MDLPPVSSTPSSPTGAGSGAGPGGKVRVGFFSFTEVTDPSAHRSYNEWHQLDHLPEQLPLPGVAWGQRWVSTPACRRARAVDGPLLAPVHYMTLYLMTDPLARTLADFAALGAELRGAGRFHTRRRSHLSGPFDVVFARAAARVLVSAAAVPFRPGTGVYVVVEETASPAQWPLEQGGVGALLDVDGVVGVWGFVASTLAGERWHPGSRRITVCFLDGDPLGAAGALAPLLSDGAGADGPSTVIFAGPLETVTPWQWDWFER